MRLKEFAIPLQALTALFLCGAMAWMVFVMAGFNPSPPTAMDIQMRSTQDVSFVSMNSTAAALAVQMVAEFVPTSIVLPATQAQMASGAPTATLGFALIPISGATLTPSPTSVSFLSWLFPPTKARNDWTATPTPQPTATKTPTHLPTLTPIPTFTTIPTSTKTSTPIPTATVPTSTPKPTATDTPTNPPPTVTKPPTATDTPEPPTSTDVPPTVPPATNTPEPPTDTSQPPPTATQPPDTVVPPTDPPTSPPVVNSPGP